MIDTQLAAQSIADGAREERRHYAKSWRGSTALLDAFELSTLTSENKLLMQTALENEGVRTEPLLADVEDRRTKVRLLLLDERSDAPQDLVGTEGLTATLWRAGESPRDIPVSDALERPEGSFLVLDIHPAAEVPAALAVLGALLPGLEEEALADLLQVDDLPSEDTYGSVHKLSTATVHALEPEHEHRHAEQSKAGALSFLVVELLAGPDWLLMCWHEPRATPAGAPVKVRKDVKSAALKGVQQCWQERGDDSIALLALLLCREVARSYPIARRTLYSWLEQWELEFHRAQCPVEQATLRDLRALISEMERRLHALEGTNFTADEGNWLAGERTMALRKELDLRLDRDISGVNNLAGTLRTATELQTSAGIRRQLELAQEQAVLTQEQAVRTRQQTHQTEHLQDLIGLVTSVLLVPTFIAGLFGANTEVPGQGHWSGFVLMVVLMVLGAGTTYTLFQRVMHNARGNAAEKSAGEGAALSPK